MYVSGVERYTYRDSWYRYARFIATIGNRSGKQVKNVKVAFLHYDGDGLPCHIPYYPDRPDYITRFTCTFKDLALNPSKTIAVGNRDFDRDATEVHCYYPTSNLHYEAIKNCTARACVVSAEFYDGTTWVNPYFNTWKSLYNYNNFL